MRVFKEIIKTLLALFWCLADPKKATAAANEAETVEDFDREMMKQWGGST